MLMIQEKIQRHYFVADLLVDLNKALNDCATAPIRPGEEVDEAQEAERGQQGASVVNTIFGVFDQIERGGGNKITVIGGKEVVSCLKKLRDVSGEYMLKLATNAVEKNGLIDASLHSDYNEKIEVASKQVVDTVNAELSESEHSISSEVTGLVAG